MTVGMLAVLLLVTPGMAAAKQGGPTRFFSLTGEIVDLEGTILVDVLDGNPLVRQYINGDDLEVLVSDGTDYWRCTGEGREYLEYGDLEVEWIIYIHGTHDAGVFTALWVIVDRL